MNGIIAILLLLSIASMQGSSAESNLRRAGVSNGIVSHRHKRELSWWTNMFDILLHHDGHSSGSGSSSSGSSSSGSSSSGSSSSGSSSSGSDHTSSASSSGSTSGSSSSSGSGSGVDSASDSAAASGSDTGLDFSDFESGNWDGIESGSGSGSGSASTTGSDYDYESHYLAGGSGAGSSIDGASGPSSLMIFIVAGMIASLVGAVMVIAWKRSRPEEEGNDAAQKLGKFIEVVRVKSQSPGSYSAPLGLSNAPAPPTTRVKSLLRSSRDLRSQETCALAMIRVKSSLPPTPTSGSCEC